MPRLRNKGTGVVVSVDDALAARLGSEWEPADAEAAPVEKSAARSRRTK